MNKKVLLLCGSPRKGGNCDVIGDEFLRGAAESGNSVKKIYINDKKINFCRGCEVCLALGAKCVQKDDMAEIIEKMLEADVIVMSSPVYFYSVSAQLKVLIDRCIACEREFWETSGKKASLISTSGSPDKNSMDAVVASFRGLFRCLKTVDEGGIIYGNGAFRKGDAKEHPAMEDAYNMGRNV